MQGHRTLSEVKTVFTPTVLVGSSLLSFVEAAACIPFWHTWIVGGAYIFVEGEGKASSTSSLLSRPHSSGEVMPAQSLISLCRA